MKKSPARGNVIKILALPQRDRKTGWQRSQPVFLYTRKREKKGQTNEQMLASAKKAGIIMSGDSVEEADGRLGFDFARV